MSNLNEVLKYLKEEALNIYTTNRRAQSPICCESLNLAECDVCDEFYEKLVSLIYSNQASLNQSPDDEIKAVVKHIEDMIKDAKVASPAPDWLTYESTIGPTGPIPKAKTVQSKKRLKPTCQDCGKSMKVIALWNFKFKRAIQEYKCHQMDCSNYMKIEKHQCIMKEDRERLSKQETYSFEDYNKE